MGFPLQRIEPLRGSVLLRGSPVLHRELALHRKLALQKMAASNAAAGLLGTLRGPAALPELAAIRGLAVLRAIRASPVLGVVAELREQLMGTPLQLVVVVSLIQWKPAWVHPSAGAQVTAGAQFPWGYGVYCGAAWVPGVVQLS
jgi:hypothetical protein